MKKIKTHLSVRWDKYGLCNNPNEEVATKELKRLKGIQKRLNEGVGPQSDNASMQRGEKINQLTDFIHKNYRKG